jgi:hypothetical protein
LPASCNQLSKFLGRRALPQRSAQVECHGSLAHRHHMPSAVSRLRSQLAQNGSVVDDDAERGAVGQGQSFRRRRRTGSRRPRWRRSASSASAGMSSRDTTRAGDQRRRRRHPYAR